VAKKTRSAHEIDQKRHGAKSKHDGVAEARKIVQSYELGLDPGYLAYHSESTKHPLAYWASYQLRTSLLYVRSTPHSNKWCHKKSAWNLNLTNLYELGFSLSLTAYYDCFNFYFLQGRGGQTFWHIDMNSKSIHLGENGVLWLTS